MRFIGYILLAAALGLAQPQGTGVISGTVYNKVTREPVRKAIVTVIWFGTPQSWGTAATDGDGHFSFNGLPAGKFQLHATKPGIGTGSYGGDLPEWLTLADGEKKRIEIGLFRQSSISGTVADTDGDPLMNAEVSVYREGYPRGTRDLIPGSVARTNDRGEFRLSSLMPGKYYVAAAKEQRGNLAQTYVRQFYGGATDWKRAIALKVGSGEEIRGIDIHLMEVRLIHLRGRLTGVPEQSEGQVTIHMTSAGEGGRRMFGSAAGPPEYRLDMPEVSPGSYYLTAELQAGSKRYFALQKLDLVEDPGEITVALAPGVDLKGRVTLEGETSEPVKSFRVNLTRGDGIVRDQRDVSAKTAPNGTYTLEQVPPGIWDIGVSPISKGGYLKSMRLGKQDVLTEEMEITASTDAPLNIVVSTRGAMVEGQVQADVRAMVPVVLVPNGKLRSVISLYEAAPADNEGKFKMTGVAPGQYKIFAFERMPAGGFRNPELIGKLDRLGAPVEIAEGAHVEANPKLITAEQLKEAEQ